MIFDQELKNNFIEKCFVKIFLKKCHFCLYTIYHHIWALEMRFSECAWHRECSPISCNNHKYDQTSKWFTEASFKYFCTRPKYVAHDIVNYCCLNLQPLSCIQQAQKLIFQNFEFVQKLSFLCLLCAYNYVRQ